MKKILVVEDDAATRLSIVMTLRQAGYDVVEAGDGQRGLEQFQSGKPDLIVTDYSLPGMNAVDMIASLRQTPAGATVPIIVMTGNESIDVLNAAMQYGVRDYLNKNEVGPESLLASIHNHLDPDAPGEAATPPPPVVA